MRRGDLGDQAGADHRAVGFVQVATDRPDRRPRGAVPRDGRDGPDARQQGRPPGDRAGERAPPERALHDVAADRHPLGLGARRQDVVRDAGCQLRAGRGHLRRDGDDRVEGRRVGPRVEGPPAAAAPRRVDEDAARPGEVGVQRIGALDLGERAQPERGGVGAGDLGGERVAVDAPAPAGRPPRGRAGPRRCRSTGRGRGRRPPSAAYRCACRAATSGRVACSSPSGVSRSRSARSPSLGRARARSLAWVRAAATRISSCPARRSRSAVARAVPGSYAVRPARTACPWSVRSAWSPTRSMPGIIPGHGVEGRAPRCRCTSADATEEPDDHKTAPVLDQSEQPVDPSTAPAYPLPARRGGPAGRTAVVRRPRPAAPGRRPLLDAAVRLAAYVCGTPTAVVNLIDADRQWQAAAHGTEPGESPRADSMCAHVVDRHRGRAGGRRP